MIFKSLNAATTTGPGLAQTFADPVDNFTLQVVTTGSPSACEVDIQISLDGVNWATVSGVNSPLGGVFPTPSAANYIFPAFNGIRANLVTFTGGTSPTVTALIAVLP